MKYALLQDWEKWRELIRRHAILIYGVPFESLVEDLDEAVQSFVEGQSYLDYLDQCAARYGLQPIHSPAPVEACTAQDRL